MITEHTQGLPYVFTPLPWEAIAATGAGMQKQLDDVNQNLDAMAMLKDQVPVVDAILGYDEARQRETLIPYSRDKQRKDQIFQGYEQEIDKLVNQFGSDPMNPKLRYGIKNIQNKIMQDMKSGELAQIVANVETEKARRKTFEESEDYQTDTSLGHDFLVSGNRFAQGQSPLTSSSIGKWHDYSKDMVDMVKGLKEIGVDIESDQGKWIVQNAFSGVGVKNPLTGREDPRIQNVIQGFFETNPGAKRAIYTRARANVYKAGIDESDPNYEKAVNMQAAKEFQSYMNLGSQYIQYDSKYGIKANPYEQDRLKWKKLTEKEAMPWKTNVEDLNINRQSIDNNLEQSKTADKIATLGGSQDWKNLSTAVELDNLYKQGKANEAQVKQGVSLLLQLHKDDENYDELSAREELEANGLTAYRANIYNKYDIGEDDINTFNSNLKKFKDKYKTDYQQIIKSGKKDLDFYKYAIAKENELLSNEPISYSIGNVEEQKSLDQSVSMNLQKKKAKVSELGESGRSTGDVDVYGLKLQNLQITPYVNGSIRLTMQDAETGKTYMIKQSDLDESSKDLLHQFDIANKVALSAVKNPEAGYILKTEGKPKTPGSKEIGIRLVYENGEKKIQIFEQRLVNKNGRLVGEQIKTKSMPIQYYNDKTLQLIKQSLDPSAKDVTFEKYVQYYLQS